MDTRGSIRCVLGLGAGTTCANSVLITLLLLMMRTFLVIQSSTHMPAGPYKA